jgi:hypothetical protein
MNAPDLPLPLAPAPVPSRGPSMLVLYWRKVGGGSFLLSVFIHIGLFLLAAMIVIPQLMVKPPVDFLPGGGSKSGQEASDAVSRQVKVNKRKVLNKSTPMRKVVSSSTLAAISLPDVPLDSIDMPELSSPLGGMMASGGFGSGGAGGGYGSGVGIGGMKGMTFKPVIMFGRELKDARKIAVVMDVSRSMTKYLPAVAKELDKIANLSVLVLFFGCGLANLKKDAKIDDEVLKTNGDQFASFWQHWQGKAALNMPVADRKKLTYDSSNPMPLEDIYKKMAGRRNTYYVEFNGIQYAWTALLCKEVMEADTIYWFADFMDKVDQDKMDEVRKKLKSRKQKLVMHASRRGRSFDIVKDGLCLPSGGEVVEAAVEAQK